MNQSSRETRVLHAVDGLMHSLLDIFDVVDVLADLTTRCAGLLGVDAVGLMVADPSRRLRVIAASSERSRELNLFRLQAADGPCADCYATGQPVSVADLNSAQSQWPQLVSAATGAGFASVHAVPVRAAGSVLGVLGLFATTGGELDPADLLVMETLAHIAAVAISGRDHPATPSAQSQMRSALARRLIVDRAQGFLQGTLSLSSDEALTLLRRYGRNRGEHVTDVARRLLTDRYYRPTMLAAFTALAGQQR
jgi:GAF domain-containing protein